MNFQWNDFASIFKDSCENWYYIHMENVFSSFSIIHRFVWLLGNVAGDLGYCYAQFLWFPFQINKTFFFCCKTVLFYAQHLTYILSTSRQSWTNISGTIVLHHLPVSSRHLSGNLNVKQITSAAVFKKLILPQTSASVKAFCLVTPPQPFCL